MSPVIRRLSAYLSLLAFCISISVLTFVYYTPYTLWPIAAVIVAWVLLFRFLRSVRSIPRAPAGGAGRALRGSNLMIIPVMIAMVVPTAAFFLFKASVG